MNVYEMVIAIVVVVTVGRVLMARFGVVHSKPGESVAFRDDGAGKAENERLRNELRGLKERIAVLERLATDADTSSARLDREIERLREK